MYEHDRHFFLQHKMYNDQGGGSLNAIWLLKIYPIAFTHILNITNSVGHFKGNNDNIIK